MPKKYKKKPVVIEAMQYNGTNKVKIQRFMGKYLDECPNGLKIPTLEGNMFASVGDYIIKGVKGEFYPCKPDIFHQTYDQVSDDDLNSDTPLTIEELRQMNGKPVWCADLNEWGIVKIETIGRWANDIFLVGHYGNNEVRTNFEVDIVRRGYKCYPKPLKGG